jgi:hypothetical protein
MYSGHKQEQMVLGCRRSEAWAWVKARGIFKSRNNAAHAKLMSSVLLTTDCGQTEEIASWRDSLAAYNHRCLAEQICDQFFDTSIIAHSSARKRVTAAEPVLKTFLPDNETEKRASVRDRADARYGPGKTKSKARILTAVLPEIRKRSAVLLSIKTRAA